jgi:hypothetical protein
MVTSVSRPIEYETSSSYRMLSSIVHEDDLVGLPAPVGRYLTYTGVIGKPWVNTARVKYHGRFRTGADKRWMRISVEQVYTVNPPGFVWKARFKFAGLPLLFATDTYKAGHGHMQGKLLGLFTVVDGRGDEVDQGTMVRYLQEMTWFPSAYLGENVTWQAVDDHAADVTLHDNGKHTSARMYFDDTGRMLSFVAQRYGEFNGKYSLNTWTAPITDYAVFGGLNLPANGKGVWLLPTGDFPYVDVRVTKIEYNQSREASRMEIESQSVARKRTWVAEF